MQELVDSRLDLMPMNGDSRVLAQAAEMRALRQIYAGVEHGLRGPLNGIVLNLELLRMEAERDGDASARDRVQGIRREVGRLMKIVEPLLATLSDSPPGRSFDLRELMKSMQEFMSPHATQRQIRIEIATQSDRPIHVRGDSHRVRSAVLILLAGLLEGKTGSALLIHVERGDAEGEVILEHVGGEKGVTLPDESWQVACDMIAGVKGEVDLDEGRNVRVRLPLAEHP